MIAKGADPRIDEEELATEAVARICSDMVLNGQGRDVLAIWAQAAPKNDDNDDGAGGKKSPLVRALERLPGMVPGPQSSLGVPVEPLEAVIPEVYAVGATHPQSVVPHGQPFFTPQRTLLPPDLDAGTPVRGELVRGPDARAPAGARAHPLPPGSPRPPSCTPVVSGNFEKNPPAGAE